MRKLICFLATGVFLLFTTCVTDPTDFAPDLQGEKSIALNEPFPPEVEEAIVSGIEWLLPIQTPDGNFGGSSNGVARTHPDAVFFGNLAV